MLLAVIYIAFISLGLPDALLGSAWPVIRTEFGVSADRAGLVSMLATGGTILSSLFSARLLSRFGTGKVTAFSVGLTACALAGFATSQNLMWLFAAAVPLGLGAGSVDAGLNAFVARHYAARHMNWLHAFWGLGAMTGPFALSLILGRGGSWRFGYGWIAAFQTFLTLVLVSSLPLWSRVPQRSVPDGSASPASLKVEPGRALFDILRIRRVGFAQLSFLAYCGLEAGSGLWGGSYLVSVKGYDPANAARAVSFFYTGITVGRLLSGFVASRWSALALMRTGCILIASGIIFLILPGPEWVPVLAFILIGLGCAPLYPTMLHATPERFGHDAARHVMGVQMAVAYTGSTLLPPAFGFVASWIGLGFLPLYLLLCLVLLYPGIELPGRHPHSVSGNIPV